MMRQTSITKPNRFKMKFNVSLLIAGLFCLSFFPSTRTTAQDATVFKAIADAAIEIGKSIDSSCDKKRPENGFTACKGGDCLPAKCISFRSRCDNGTCG